MLVSQLLRVKYVIITLFYNLCYRLRKVITKMLSRLRWALPPQTLCQLGPKCLPLELPQLNLKQKLKCLQVNYIDILLEIIFLSFVNLISAIDTRLN